MRLYGDHLSQTANCFRCQGLAISICAAIFEKVVETSALYCPSLVQCRSKILLPVVGKMQLSS